MPNKPPVIDLPRLRNMASNARAETRELGTYAKELRDKGTLPPDITLHHAATVKLAITNVSVLARDAEAHLADARNMLDNALDTKPETLP